MLAIGVLGPHSGLVADAGKGFVGLGHVHSFAGSVGSSIVVSERDILCKVTGGSRLFSFLIVQFLWDVARAKLWLISELRSFGD